MPIGAITMILANVGLQIYNNWCGSRQNAALQQKREEFERAAKDRNTEHMWRLMREGQELTLQLENEKHADRLKELKDEVDHLLERLTYETTISNWPLKVLPIVMKNQAFGNLLANQEENIAMHVVFTRSNYDKFNKLVYPIVEKQLEQYCDKHWSTMTDHPILFYSGAWKPMVNPTDVQVTAMREELKNLPTLLITPFFRPNDGKFVFQLHMWGVGANSTDKFDVPEIEPTDFQRTFTNQDDYDNEEGLLEEIVEDIVPYLECMIGYMADTYFWSSAGLAPHLPLLLTNGAVNTDGMKYLVEGMKENYNNLIRKCELYQYELSNNNLLKLIEGCILLESERENKLEKVLFLLCSNSLNKNICNWGDLQREINSTESVDFSSFQILKNIEQVKNVANKTGIKTKELDKTHCALSEIKYEQYEIFNVENSDLKSIYALVKAKECYANMPTYLIFIVWNPHIIIATFCNSKYNPCIYSKLHTARYFILRNIKIKSSTKKDWNGTYYCFNLNKKTILKMKEKSFEKQFGKSFERIGRGLGRMFDAFDTSKDSPTNNVWGDESEKDSNTSGIDRIVSYFIANAGKSIPAERVEEMSIKNVLDWVDKNVTPFATKVYIVKGVNEKYKKLVFCVFFGAGEKVLLQKDAPCICFISSQCGEDVKQAFRDNDICEIPLK